MLRNEYFVIGLMSGTSLDGVDLVYVNFKSKNRWDFSILNFETVPYPQKWFDTLSNLATLSYREIEKIDEDYTTYLAKVINKFIEKHHISNLDIVASHGHTALHQPHNGITYQIGNLEQLAQLIGVTVVCDFRKADVELGGQGAPLVPIGDLLLFSNYDYCLNLGGFSNVSFDKNNQRLAYDICPVNTVLNYYANSFGFDFDNEGLISKSGSINQQLFNQLNNLEYYNQSYPKSLGMEYVNEVVLPLIESFKIESRDKMRTFVEHIALQIGNNIDSSIYVNLLITGGGAKNKFLIERIASYFKGDIIIPDDCLIDYKEALIFALLGVLKLRGEINCLKSVTGAKMDHSSGKIYSVK